LRQNDPHRPRAGPQRGTVRECDWPGYLIARLLLCAVDGKIVVLHGFAKKTRKMPDDDMTLARRRERGFDR
jgi:phage-related protein